MKRIHKAALAALLAASAALASCSYRNDDYSTRTVSVHGIGTVEVDADNATITMSVVTRGESVAGASNENAHIMTEVRKSVLALGIEKDSVTTENYSLMQESNYIDGKQVMGDYRVTNQIKIHIKKVEMVSDIIDTALRAGANRLSSLEYGISDNALAIKQARTLAVQQAQEAAQLIAGTSGARLGKVLRVEEQQNFANSRNVRFASKAMASADMGIEESASTPVSGGKSNVTVSVDAIYELK